MNCLYNYLFIIYWSYRMKNLLVAQFFLEVSLFGKNTTCNHLVETTLPILRGCSLLIRAFSVRFICVGGVCTRS